MAYTLNQSVTPVRTALIHCGVLCATIFYISAGLAQAPTPPITSSGLNTQLSGPMPVDGKTRYDITGGTREGTNLFHSFGDFNVPNNNIANFLNNTGLATNNILGRVTSGNASNIFGTIQTTGFGDANLFLMNPAGIVFGPTAALNVGGSVTFTTANYMRLTQIKGESGLFHANPALPSLLTSAPVAAFGFLGPSPAIALNGSNLEVQPGHSIALIGGNITTHSTILGNSSVRSVHSELVRQVNLASAASAGEFLAGTLDQAPNINGQSFRELGTIRVEQSTINTGGPGGGSVLIRGGQFILKNSTISSRTTGPGNLTNGAETIGGGVNILTSQDVVIGDGSAVETKVTGNATHGTTYGGVRINASRINILGIPGSSPESAKITSIKSDTEGSGNAGNIILHATGNIEITNLVNLATISKLNSTGNAGNVELSSTHGNIQITKNAFTQVTSQTFNNSSGTTGKVIASAPNGDIVLDGANLFTSASPKSGGGGRVAITARNLRITNTGLLSTDNDSLFRPDGITVTLSGELRIAGGFITTSSVNDTPAGDISLKATDIVATQGTIINSAAFASGSGGQLRIIADTLQVTDGAQLSSGSNRAPNRGSLPQNIDPSGRGGDITIHTLGPRGSILIDGKGSGIFAESEGRGIGGNISLTAGKSISLNNGGSISASSTGPGNAGSITINGDSLTIASGGRIEASTSNTGKGGSIAIATTGDVTVTGMSADGQVRSGIYAKTLSDGGRSGNGSGGGGGGSGGGSGGGDQPRKPGSAGDITISAKNLLLDGGAQIDSSTTSGGTGGKVSIATAENIIIAGSSTRLTSDATRGNGNGGSLTLVAKNITVRDNASITAATGGKGDAGDVSLTALDQLHLQSAGTVTTSTSGSGKGGTIVIQANQVLLEGQGTRISAETLPPFADMTITINILHANVGDLVVRLDSPTGTRVALLSRVGGSGQNFIGTQFNDRAPTQITSGSAPFTGTFTPREPLGQLNKELATGNWTLSVQDQTTGNIGSLESWTLQIGEQTFRSTGPPVKIPDNGNVPSTITVANPTMPTIQGVGEAPGIGGNIVLAAGQSVSILDGASITASSTGSGAAGNVEINAGKQFNVEHGSITTQSSQLNGGNITIQASDLVRVVEGKISTSALTGGGNGGNISIDPKVVLLQSSEILAQANRGNGGDISITTPVFVADQSSRVDASTPFGLNGKVTIQSPTSNLSGTVGQLVSKTSPPQVLLQNRCVAMAGGSDQSTFILTGRTTLPAEPGGWLRSPVSVEHWTGEETEHASGLMVRRKEPNESPTMATRLDKIHILSLRRLTPPGFLVRTFATGSTGCPS